MMGDEAMMGLIFGLHRYLDIKPVLEDPSAMSAVNSGDLEVLKSNPNFMKHLGNLTIQESTGKV